MATHFFFLSDNFFFFLNCHPVLDNLSGEKKKKKKKKTELQCKQNILNYVLLWDKFDIFVVFEDVPC